MGGSAKNARPHVVSRWFGLPLPAVGESPGAEGEAVPRHAANAGGAGRGRRSPARPAAVPPSRRAGRARAPLSAPELKSEIENTIEQAHNILRGDQAAPPDLELRRQYLGPGCDKPHEERFFILDSTDTTQVKLN